MKQTSLIRARAVWPDPIPDWVETLALECDRTSQNKVAASGTVLATLVLPADFLAAAAAGAKTILCTWQDASADATGTAGHFRINQGVTCHVQGSITATGGGGDMTLDNVSIAAAQQVTVTAFTINAGGA